MNSNYISEHNSCFEYMLSFSPDHDSQTYRILRYLLKREDVDFILTCCLHSFQYCTLLSFSTHQHRKNTYRLRIKELEYVYIKIKYPHPN
ncbi:hypothetical protein T02_3289 [Trichinella nativa]|uniref:Uncharacterized protein n=1 Tax=Trichinella nativa TaxID=6335 RepID=A0A0V1LQF9_9BILA|nr:hypothetical protein T02_3289 [Trichinella nativa]